MQDSGWQTIKSGDGLTVINIQHPEISHTDRNPLYSIIRALNKKFLAYGQDDLL
jgi:hypothetical protein